MHDLRNDQRDTAATAETTPHVYPSPTTGQEVEIILARQLAGYLAAPIVITDPNRVVIYYNEPAERLLGRRFDEGGPVDSSEWSKKFSITDETGLPLPVDEIPLSIALRHGHVAHRTYYLQGMDGVRHHVNTTAIPLTGNAGRFLGVVAIYDELED